MKNSAMLMLLSLLIVGCSSADKKPAEVNYQFSLHPHQDRAQRFSITAMWQAEVLKQSTVRYKEGRDKRRSDRIEGREQVSQYKQQLLTRLERTLIEQEICKKGYRVIDLYQRQGLISLTGECR